MAKTIYFTQDNHFRHSSLRCSLLLSAMILLIGSSTNVFGQVAIPLWHLYPENYKKDDGINYSLSVDGHLFVSTRRGMLIIDQDRRVVSANSITGNYRGTMVQFSGSVLYGTSDGLWLVNTDGRAILVSGIEGVVYQVTILGEYAFCASEKGLYVVSQQGKAFLMENIEGSVNTMQEIGELLFVGTVKGLYIVKQSEVSLPISSIKGNIRSVIRMKNKAFVEAFVSVTDKQFWVVSGDGEATTVKGIKGLVNSAEEVGDYLFVNSQNDLGIVNQNGVLVSAQGISGDISSLQKVIW